MLRLALDNPATVTLEAAGGQTFPGRVVEIGASALAAGRHAGGRARVPGEGAPDGRRVAAAPGPDVRRRDPRGRAHRTCSRCPSRPWCSAARTPGSSWSPTGVAKFAVAKTGIIGGLDDRGRRRAPKGPRSIAGPFQALREMKDGTPGEGARRDALIRSTHIAVRWRMAIRPAVAPPGDHRRDRVPARLPGCVFAAGDPAWRTHHQHRRRTGEPSHRRLHLRQGATVRPPRLRRRPAAIPRRPRGPQGRGAVPPGGLE